MKISGFQKQYQKKLVLDVPPLELKEGTKYALIGPNGSGKSTFARILAGIIQDDSRSRIVPQDVSVGYMPQRSYGFRMSVLNNLLLKNKDRGKAELLTEKLAIHDLNARNASRLSGGETARVALGRLLMNRYDLLILDEPSASMDMESTVISERAILDYQEECGCTLLLITHSIMQAKRICDEVLFFCNGRIAEQGEIHAAIDDPKSPELKQFLRYFGN